jgi:hypothetical protein
MINCEKNFLFDLRTRRLMKIHGPELVYAYINLSASIYRDNGYYAVFDEEKVSDLVRKCVDAELFDQEKFEQYGILTSREIQKNFLFATKRRKNTSLNKDYLIEKKEQREERKEKPESNVTDEKQDATTCMHDVDKTGFSSFMED